MGATVAYTNTNLREQKGGPFALSWFSRRPAAMPSPPAAAPPEEPRPPQYRLCAGEEEGQSENAVGILACSRAGRSSAQALGA